MKVWDRLGPLFIVGYMASGKTVIACKLAESLGYPWLDTDQIIENEEGIPISTIIDTQGEPAFRMLEYEVIQNISSTTPTIISTGGGLPCYNNLMDKLTALGTTIYIETPIAHIVERLAKDNTRPLIKGLNRTELQEYVTKHYYARRRIYEQSDLRIRNNNTIDKVVERIVTKLS